MVTQSPLSVAVKESRHHIAFAFDGLLDFAALKAVAVHTWEHIAAPDGFSAWSGK